MALEDTIDELNKEIAKLRKDRDTFANLYYIHTKGRTEEEQKKFMKDRAGRLGGYY